MSYSKHVNMLNTVQHTNMIKVFLSINDEEIKPCLNTQYCCVYPNYLRASNFLPQNVKNKQKLTFEY